MADRVMHNSHSQAEKPNTSVISKLETLQGKIATHNLQDQERPHQLNCNVIWNDIHSHPAKPRTSVISRFESRKAWNHSLAEEPKTDVSKLETHQGRQQPLTF